MKVYLLGAGPGDPGLLTLKARDVLAAADVVIYDALANDSLLGHARPDAELIYVGKVAGNHALPQREINALLVRKAKEGKVVARLKGGDPYIFGRGGEEAEELLAAGVPFEEVPGISSTIAAPAYAGIPLTHRDFASSVTIITGHENPDKPGSVHNWQALARSASTLVFVMGMKNLPDIVRNLLDAGMDPQTPAALVYRGATPRQRSLTAALRDLPQAAREAHFTNPAVIVVGKVVSLHDKLNWFEQKPLLGKSIVVTRAREQASGLAGGLTELGAEVIQCPTIEIRPLPEYAALDAAVALLARGIRPDFVPERYVAEGVVEGLLAREGGQLAGRRMLLPRAAKARDVLPVELGKAGALVDVLPAYETIPAAGRRDAVLERLEEGSLSCVTFGSSSTVENFLSLIPAEKLKEHPETRLAAIGPITARTLREHGLEAHIQPEEYTIPALVKTITDYFTRGPAAL